jgi:DNA-binding transcriptional LysR family regulator
MKVITLNNAEAIKYAVSLGLGIGLVGVNILNKHSIGKEYHILNVERFPITLNAFLVHKHKHVLSPAAKVFLELALPYWQQAHITGS